MMNLKKISFAGVFSVLLVIASSCDKEDGGTHNVNPGPENRLPELQVHNDKYRLDVTAYKDFGESSNGSYSGYKIELLVLVDGMQLFEADGKIDSISGDGKLLSLELFSSAESELALGVYGFSSSYGQLNSFSKGYIIDYNGGVADQSSRYEIQTGTLTVENDGEQFTIEGELMDDEKKSISFYDKGKPEYFDYR